MRIAGTQPGEQRVSRAGDVSPEAMREHALVASARAGNAAAFTRLVERFEPPLLRYLYHQTGDAQVAADLTQETFLAAWRNLAQLADERAFAAWLYRIAGNQLRMARRSRRPLLSLDRLLERAGGLIPTLRRTDSTAPVPERDAVQRALEHLTPPLREALLLHRLWGFSGAEVAALLEISPAAARKRIVRATEQFRHFHRLESGDGDSHADL